MTSFWSYANRYPPCLVRLLARHRGGPPLTTSDIVGRSGLDHYTVSAISWSISWAEVPFGQMERFLKGCNIDFCDRKSMNRVACYMKLKHRFLYLRRSPEFEPILRLLVSRWREHLASKINQRT